LLTYLLKYLLAGLLSQLAQSSLISRQQLIDDVTSIRRQLNATDATIDDVRTDIDDITAEAEKLVTSAEAVRLNATVATLDADTLNDIARRVINFENNITNVDDQVHKGNQSSVSSGSLARTL